MLGTKKPKAVAQVLLLPIQEIVPNPHQPRKVFEQGAMEELARSIAANGLLQPITVTRTEHGWQLIAGHRRLMACSLLGWKTIPAIPKDLPPESPAVLALVENIHRSGLNYFEEAWGISEIMTTCHYTQQQAAAILGRSQPAIANKLRLLRLPQEVKTLLLDAGLTERHARALLRIEDPDLCLRATKTIAAGQMSVHKAEEYIEKLLNPVAKKNPTRMVIRDVRLLFNSINKAVETVRMGGLPIDATKTEDEEYIHYIVSVPKAAALGRALGKGTLDSTKVVSHR